MSEMDKIYQEATAKRDEFESKLVLKAWENEDFRKEFLANPSKVFERELGQKVPANVEISVLEEKGNKIYFVIPHKPVKSTAEGVLSEDALAQVAAGVFGMLYQGPIVDTSGGTTKVEPAKFFLWW